MSTKLRTKLIVLMLLLLVSCQTPESELIETESLNESAGDPATATAAVEEEPTAAVVEAAPAAQWQEINRISEDFLPGYVAFAGPDFGISSCVSSPPPPLHHFTTDGGQSWETSRCIFRTSGIDLVDDQSIWICGEGNLKASMDAGQSWEQLGAPLGEGCKMLSFADNQTGWAASSSILMATTDGGENWDEVGMPNDVQKLAALSIRTAGEGYIVDDGLTFYSTSDGGESWTARALPIEDSDLAFAPLGISAAAVRFIDSNNGVIVINLAGGGNSKVLALHTADGGETWEHHEVPAELGSIYLSHDGAYLTVTEPGKDIVILENQELAHSDDR